MMTYPVLAEMSNHELLDAARKHLCLAQLLFDAYAQRLGLNNDSAAGEEETPAGQEGGSINDNLDTNNGTRTAT
jgi:hypothetical protein